MTPLAQERMLVFSPTLAATLGLEEAVLLYQLHDLGAIRNQAVHDWQTIEFETLERLLPFWSRDDLQRIAASLAAKGVLETEWTSRAGVAAALCFRQAPSPGARSSAPLPATTVPARPAPPAATMDSAGAASTGSAGVGVGVGVAAGAGHDRTGAPAGTTATALRGLSVRESQPVHSATVLTSDWMPQEDTLHLLALKNIPRAFAIDQLEEFILYWRERGKAEYAWDNKFRKHVIERWQRGLQVAASGEQAAATPDPVWYPSVDALQILERTGINREFIEDTIPEFVLYWRERGDNTGTWNSKFIAHIRRQWARYSNALEHDQEPRPIASNWQPSEDVYDILRMANIDIQFACELLPEFILFWRDAGTPQRSWNTKFLQHIKYQWATRHHMNGAQRAGSAIAAGAPAAPASAFERLTDRSWASGLVEGV